jgi:glycosyltransferase involved in cell wall biosynthesis
MQRPLVSVVIPVFNGERYLADALDSALLQDYRPVEIIVVDDGSTDRSADIARSYSSVRYMYQANAGPAAARNSGISVSRGEFTAFLDSDDMWGETKLSADMELLCSDPYPGFTMSRGEFFLDGLSEWPEWVECQRGARGEFPPLQGAIVVRKQIFEQIGTFDPGYLVAEDTDWLFRALDAGIPMAVVPHATVRRRIHTMNASYQQGLARRQLLQAVRTAIRRRREHPSGGSGPPHPEGTRRGGPINREAQE